MKHATFSPSAAQRWLACPGSVKLGLDAPPEPVSTYAEEGTRMHELAARVIQGIASNIAHEHLTNDALSAVAAYVNFINERIAESAWYSVEAAIRFDDSLFGTADYIGFTHDETLDVVDFKGGAGIMVAAHDNAQMKTYAWLAWNDPTFKVHARAAKQVRMTIFQPRAPNGPLREEVFDVLELAAWGNTLKRGMKAALSALPELHTGIHCRFCPAAPICPKLKTAAGQALARDPHGMTGKDLAQLLDQAETLERWIAQLREYASAQITSGALVPGWIMRPKRATRKWIEEGSAAIALRERGAEPYERVLISVAAAEKLLGKEKIQELAGLWSAESSGYTLARGDEPSLQEKAALIMQHAGKNST